MHERKEGQTHRTSAGDGDGGGGGGRRRQTRLLPVVCFSRGKEEEEAIQAKLETFERWANSPRNWTVFLSLNTKAIQTSASECQFPIPSINIYFQTGTSPIRPLRVFLVFVHNIKRLLSRSKKKRLLSHLIQIGGD